ncbi:hypothetical protein RFI_39888, partial [Reticulomyxa filosa]
SSIRNYFLNIFNDSEFRKLLSDSKDFEDFIHFLNDQHQKQIIWRDKHILLETIKACIGSIQYCEKTLLSLIDLLWNKLLSDKSEVKEQITEEVTPEIKQQVVEVTRKLLKKSQSLEGWIKLFSCDVQSQNNTWQELLTESWK